MRYSFLVCGIWLAFVSAIATGDDWPRFRGPAGTGIATDSDELPIEWSPTKNVSWKVPLPGPGASSPIIVQGKALVTCYSGYGLDRDQPGDIENLVRHLVCVDLQTGRQIWQRDIPATLPEDSYDKSGVSSHGYASHTPASDGTNVYCFFGKGGVHAFDLHGNALWQAEAGKESDPPRWGSASSPVIFSDTVIVTASAECQSIIGFDKTTGERLWQQEASGLDGMWGTPTFAKLSRGRTDLVMLVAKEVWGLDPGNGELRWFTAATDSSQAYASVVAQDGQLWACSGAGSVAFSLKDEDVPAATRLWSSRVSATYASPVCHGSRLYVVSRGVLSVVDAETGKRITQMRLKGAKTIGNARFGSLDYASPVVAGNRLYSLNAGGQMYVFRLGDEPVQLAVNRVTTNPEVFWGSPAVSQDRMVLRSSECLYCIAEGSELVPRKIPEAAANQHGRPDRQLDNSRLRDSAANDHRAVESGTSAPDTRPHRPQRPVRAAN